jgi:hypothetical protein
MACRSAFFPVAIMSHAFLLPKPAEGTVADKYSKMKNFFYIIGLLFVISCSNGEIKQIENANCTNGSFPAQGAFLINTSNNKRIQFTIKSYPDNQSKVVTNTIYILEPGAQAFLGCTTLEHNYHYEIVGEREMK